MTQIRACVTDDYDRVFTWWSDNTVTVWRRSSGRERREPDIDTLAQFNNLLEQHRVRPLKSGRARTPARG